MGAAGGSELSAFKHMYDEKVFVLFERPLDAGDTSGPGRAIFVPDMSTRGDTHAREAPGGLPKCSRNSGWARMFVLAFRT